MEDKLDPNIAVKLDHVTVSFRSYQEQPTSLKEAILRYIKTRELKHYSTFDALTDVSLEVFKGKVLGIIGSNGAGKSTLLRSITGVLKPAKGRVYVNGRIDSLISLGAGFDPELNAIENIFLNGSLYQQSWKEMEQRVWPILEFAELKEFATTPIKYYSSGMSARLGFAVAIDRDPDILLVDEVLAVGDDRFQQKCLGVFDDYLAKNKTIIMVSHSMAAIENMCDQVVLLSKGRAIYTGEAKQAIELYQCDDYETRLS